MFDSILTTLKHFVYENGGLFLVFLIMNILDWLTGTAKARYLKKENSSSGIIGVIKKLGNWIIILIAFAMAYAFIKLGKMIGIDLGLTNLLGWFVLLTLTANEIRSILENLIECNIKVPKFLIKGLEVCNEKIEEVTRNEKNN